MFAAILVAARFSKLLMATGGARGLLAEQMPTSCSDMQTLGTREPYRAGGVPGSYFMGDCSE